MQSTASAQDEKEKMKGERKEREREGRASRVAGSSGSELRPKRSAFAALTAFLSYEVAGKSIGCRSRDLDIAISFSL